MYQPPWMRSDVKVREFIIICGPIKMQHLTHVTIIFWGRRCAHGTKTSKLWTKCFTLYSNLTHLVYMKIHKTYIKLIALDVIQMMPMTLEEFILFLASLELGLNHQHTQYLAQHSTRQRPAQTWTWCFAPLIWIFPHQPVALHTLRNHHNCHHQT